MKEEPKEYEWKHVVKIFEPETKWKRSWMYVEKDAPMLLQEWLRKGHYVVEAMTSEPYKTSGGDSGSTIIIIAKERCESSKDN